MVTSPRSTPTGTGSARGGTGKVRYAILAVLFTGIAINYVDRATISVAMPFMSDELGLSDAVGGVVLSAFFWTYAAGQMPGGFLADRLGPRKMLLIASLLWGLSTMAMGLAWGVASLIVLRLVLGIGESPAFPASAQVVSRWFPRSERSFASATFNNGNPVGATLSVPLVALAIATLGWRWAFVLAGALGVVWALVWWKFYREPREHPRIGAAELAHIEHDQEAEVPPGEVVSWGQLFRFRAVWAMMIGFFCVNFVAYFFITWFPTFLVKTYGLSLLKFGFYGMIPGIASMIGGWCGGLLSDHLVRRGVSLTVARKIPLVGGLLGTSVIALAVISPSMGVALTALSASYFCSTFAAASVWALPADFAPTPGHVGSLGGIQNTAANIAGIVSPILIGVITGLTSSFALPLLIAGGVALTGAAVYAFLLPPVRRLRLG
ncbi:MFS transporter [Saccharopolyspora sp. WRP15-2]|uniref:MFS transporter n=1 Tax=Saccharopolyspora oryzae TaxID=2997343 RepID=A0ABT4V0I7_9PSEU|nr:MFS transporter [Saccharopolyspora oryzae]MDA3627476.1 MFS transporter [Saccharopolyspora oryzae]